MASELYKEVAPSGGDYTTLEACMDGNEKNLVTADEYFNVEITGDWTSATDETNVYIQNYTADATRFITIYATGTAKHDGTAYKTTAYELLGANDANSNFRQNGIDYTVIKDFVINGRGNDRYLIYESLACDNCITERMIIHNSINTTAGVFISTSSSSTVYRNCLLFNLAKGITCQSNNGNVTAYHITTFAMGSGTVTNGMTNIKGVNCYDGRFTTWGDFVSMETGTNYNVSSDDTADDVGANYAINKNSYTDYFESITGGSEDFNLKGNGTTLWSFAGTDLSGTVDDDLVGNSRSAYDPGCFEFVSAGGYANNVNGVAAAGWGGNATNVVEAIGENTIWSINIVDNLTSTDATKVLSAKQGKVLEDGKVDLATTLVKSRLDSPPADDATTAPTSKWYYDNIYNPSYKTDWATYTTATTITHNLGVAFEDLEIRVLNSASGGTDLSDYQDVTNMTWLSQQGPATIKTYGFFFYAIDSNSIKLYVGDGGGGSGIYIESDGTFTAASVINFKIIIRKRIFK